MDGYKRERALFGDVSTSATYTAASTTATLIAAKTNFTIYVQRIIVWISTDAAQSWSFQDSSAKQCADVPSSPGDSTRWDFDYGAKGFPLTESASLTATMSAAGLAGTVVVEAYQKLTAATNA
jgi:hypothetical protein